MSDVKASGAATSAIKVAVDIETMIDGKSTIRLDDGTVIDGPTKQNFRRISTEIKQGLPVGLNEGDWLINPATNETHKIVSVAFGVVGHIAITTKSGQAGHSLEEIAETLLLVVNG